MNNMEVCGMEVGNIDWCWLMPSSKLEWWLHICLFHCVRYIFLYKHVLFQFTLITILGEYLSSDEYLRIHDLDPC